NASKYRRPFSVRRFATWEKLSVEKELMDGSVKHSWPLMTNQSPPPAATGGESVVSTPTAPPTWVGAAPSVIHSVSELLPASVARKYNLLLTAVRLWGSVNPALIGTGPVPPGVPSDRYSTFWLVLVSNATKDTSPPTTVKLPIFSRLLTPG